MDIFEIKQRTRFTQPYFFDWKTLEFFGQTMRDFLVTPEGKRYKIEAPMKDSSGKVVGLTVRYFNPETNDLEIK